MLETSETYRIFAVEGSLIWFVIGKSSISPILLKDRCPPFFSINHLPSELQLRKFLTKYAFSEHLLKNMCPIEPNCRLLAHFVESYSSQNYG